MCVKDIVFVKARVVKKCVHVQLHVLSVLWGGVLAGCVVVCVRGWQLRADPPCVAQLWSPGAGFADS